MDLHGRTVLKGFIMKIINPFFAFYRDAVLCMPIQDNVFFAQINAKKLQNLLFFLQNSI